VAAPPGDRPVTGMSTLAGRTAVVTGASSGIGCEIARELHRRGAAVVLVARSADRLAELAVELGGRVHVLPADLSDRAARAGLLDRVTATGSAPDVLVNNAGLSTVGPVHRSDPEAELNLVEVDVAAVVDLCSRFLPGMVARGRGAVLNVASTAAFQPLPGQAAYGGAKAFVLAYTQALGAELRRTGVTATALCPGPVATRFADTAGFDAQDAQDALPAFKWLPAAAVARAPVDGLEKGRPVVIPGASNRVGAHLSRLAPRRLLLPILARNHPGLRSSPPG
jgi:short-subunit dehydrogenase